MEPNEYKKIREMVDRIADLIRKNGLDGIKELYNELGDEVVTKSILAIVMLQHADLAESISNYLRLARYVTEHQDSAHKEHNVIFETVRKLIDTKIELLGKQVYHQEDEAASKTVREIHEILEDCLNRSSFTNPGERRSREGVAFDTIKTLQRRLDRISDFVHINNHDKLLTDMARLQGEMRQLEKEIQEILLK